MTETEVAPVAEKVVAKTDSPKKAAKKPSTKANHPSTAEMVTAAISTLAERHGSSLQAIKKYVASTYKVDVDKQNMFIKKFLRSAVEKGILIQTKGKGAAGSFKLAPTTAAAKPKPKTISGGKKPASPKKAAAKKPAVQKTLEPKSSPVKNAPAKRAVAKKAESPKKSVAKSPVKSKASASPKAKRATKAPTAKPKSPKPKRVAASKTAKSPVKKVVAKK